METNHLNQHQLAKRWSMSPKTLERWRWLGIGPKFLKLGGKVVYRIADVEAYEAESIRTGTAKSEVEHPEDKARQLFQRDGQ